MRYQVRYAGTNKIYKGVAKRVTIHFSPESIEVVATSNDEITEDGYFLSTAIKYGNEIAEFVCDKFTIKAQ